MVVWIEGFKIFFNVKILRNGINNEIEYIYCDEQCLVFKNFRKLK